MPKKVINGGQPVSDLLPAQRNRHRIPEKQGPERLESPGQTVYESAVVEHSAAVYDRDRSPLPKPPRHERSSASSTRRIGFWIPVVLLMCLTLSAAVGFSMEISRKGNLGWSRLLRSSFR